MSKQSISATAMVATGNPLAAQAALQMLQHGGTAVDAAIAADAVMGVVEPMATSIGGDLLAMIHSSGQPVQSYNGTGRAPLALDADNVAALPGQRIPERHPWSVTTPGAVRGWHDLHAKYGRLPWKQLFAHAIKHARDGFAVAAVAAREWAIFDFVVRQHDDCARLYRAGNSPSAGEQFVNPELADVLEMIAQEGADAFYQGWIPEQASQTVQRAGGLLTVQDFHQHTGNYCMPVSQRFNGFEVHQCPPNTHGVAILDALQKIEQFAGTPYAPETHIAMIEATASAMKQAKSTVADPAGNTVCTVIVDGNGLAITLMSSIFKRFGSGIVVPGGGFVLQNRGFGFSSPGHINGPGPGKRPYHTVVPGITTLNNEFYLGMGVVGGLMQPQGQIQILTQVLAWDSGLPQAINAPRWRLEAGDTLAIEHGMPSTIEAAMRGAGYCKPPVSAGELAGRSDFGGAHAIVRLSDNTLLGAADQRKDGCVVAV